MARLIQATGPAEVAAVRELFAEYARMVDEPCCFAGFERELAAAAIAAARDAGCARIVLDTLPRMREAIALYAFLGFKEIQPYLPKPTPGALCFELRL